MTVQVLFADGWNYGDLSRNNIFKITMTVLNYARPPDYETGLLYNDENCIYLHNNKN